MQKTHAHRGIHTLRALALCLVLYQDKIDGDEQRRQEKNRSRRLAGLGLWQQATDSFISCFAEQKSFAPF